MVLWGGLVTFFLEKSDGRFDDRWIEQRSLAFFHLDQCGWNTQMRMILALIGDGHNRVCDRDDPGFQQDLVSR